MTYEALFAYLLGAHPLALAVLAGVYGSGLILAVRLRAWDKLLLTAPFLPVVFGLLLLAGWLGLGLGDPSPSLLPHPLLALAIIFGAGGPALTLYWRSPLGRMRLVGPFQLGWGRVLRKLLFLFLWPLAVLTAMGAPAGAMGLRLPSGPALLLTVALFVTMFALVTALNFGKGAAALVRLVGRRKLLSAFGISFVYYLCYTAIPEEFLWRVVLQSAVAQVVDVPTAVIVSSLVFGLVHIPFLHQQSGSWVGSYASAALIHVVLGLLLGVLWATTHSFLSVVLVHAIINSQVHLKPIIKLLFVPKRKLPQRVRPPVEGDVASGG